MNPMVTPTFFVKSGFDRVLVSQGFQRWLSWTMLRIPRFVVLLFKMNPMVTPTFFVKSGFDRVLVFPGISKMAFLGDAENPTFYSLPF